jgi:predicted dehydrogenase
MPEKSPPRIGVVLEAFTGRPLDNVLGWLRQEVPEVTDIEVGAGGYALHPHCDVAALLASRSLTAMLRFGDLPVAIHWIDLPGIARYEMEFALYAPEARVRLAYPSPFLRSEPTLLETEGGDSGTARSWRIEETVSYESPFKRELVAFHDCVVNGTEPVTSGLDGLRDIALCQAIISSHRRGRPVDHPTRLGAGQTDQEDPQ